MGEKPYRQTLDIFARLGTPNAWLSLCLFKQGRRSWV